MPLHHRTCSLCEAMCGLMVEFEGERIVSIRGDQEDVFSQGFLCPKATGLEDIHQDPDRLRFPVRRTASGWERVSWTEALDETATRLTGLQRAGGRDALGVYLGNPSVHNLGTLLFWLPFVRALGTRNRFSATSVDQLPHQLAAFLMFGHQLLLPIPDVDRTDFLLVLGANPVVSNGSLMSAPGMPRRLKDLRKRGGRLVVVDPRRTETAELADAHHFIRPGTDALLLLGMLSVLFEEKRVRPGRLAERVDGLQAVEQLVRAFPAEVAAGPTGIPAEAIRALARDFAAAPSAVAYGRVGLSTQEFGGLSQWLLNVLNVVTGNLDRAGGAMFTRPAVDLASGLSRGHFARRRSRVRELPEFGGEFPVAGLAEEILTPGPGRITGLVTVAGNPVLSTPNGTQLDRALAALDFMVSIDFYVNETTRHAHLILPPTSPLEHEHYDLVFHLLAVRNTAKYSPALFAPPPGALHDWEIFNRLSVRLARQKKLGWLRAPARALALRVATPERLLDLGLRAGPYGRRSPRRLSLRALKRLPHGIDLGPLEPCLPGRLFTAERRIRLAPPELMADVERLRQRLLGSPAELADGRLRLIGRRHLRSNNSWMHNSERLVKGPVRCTLLMHPLDAAARGLVHGQPVRVESRVGSIPLPLEVTEEMMPGTVSAPHGWGHGRRGVQATVASAHAGASINDLTDDQAVDALTGGAAFSGVPVHVRAA